jgi:protein O-GlcNAc transferase
MRWSRRCSWPAVQREAGADAADLPAQRPLAAAAQPMSRSAGGPARRRLRDVCLQPHLQDRPEAFDAWCAVMRDVPHAVLWLKETNGQLHDNVQREAAARGVDPQRILFAPTVTMPITSRAWRWPMSSSTPGPTTPTPRRPMRCGPACRWSPDPATLCLARGGQCAQRRGPGRTGLRDAAGLPLRHHRLALEPALLAGYRQPPERAGCLPLFDGQRYTREFETLLQRMWARWRAGLSLPITCPPNLRRLRAGPTSDAQDLCPEPF